MTKQKDEKTIVISARVPRRLYDALVEELEDLEEETFGAVRKPGQALRYLAIEELKRRRAARDAKE